MLTAREISLLRYLTEYDRELVPHKIKTISNYTVLQNA